MDRTTEISFGEDVMSYGLFLGLLAGGSMLTITVFEVVDYLTGGKS